MELALWYVLYPVSIGNTAEDRKLLSLSYFIRSLKEMQTENIWKTLKKTSPSIYQSLL